MSEIPLYRVQGYLGHRKQRPPDVTFALRSTLEAIVAGTAEPIAFFRDTSVLDHFGATKSLNCVIRTYEKSGPTVGHTVG